MGGKSSSSSSREYNTENISQQGEGNVHGDNNVVTVERADAQTLDNIAKTLGEGVRDLTGAGVTMAGGAFDLAGEVAMAGQESTQAAMDFASSFTEREQVGNAGNATRTVMVVAVAAAVALVGIAWASKKG